MPENVRENVYAHMKVCVGVCACAGIIAWYRRGTHGVLGHRVGPGHPTIAPAPEPPARPRAPTPTPTSKSGLGDDAWTTETCFFGLVQVTPPPPFSLGWYIQTSPPQPPLGPHLQEGERAEVQQHEAVRLGACGAAERHRVQPQDVGVALWGFGGQGRGREGQGGMAGRKG